MRELQDISDDVGIFGKIKDEDIKKFEGVRYSDKLAMRDPMSGLFDYPEGGDVNAENQTE
jgi:hypothetical protein